MEVDAPAGERGKPFLLTGEGWPYLLVPLIPVAVVLEFAHAGATWVFLAGYLTVWLLFSVVAAIAQSLLTGPSMAVDNRTAQAAVLAAAGLYQLSRLKAACIGLCRSPAQFISRHWRPGWDGAVRLGVRHGIYCLGCCWMLMALLFVGGIMNLLWVVGLTLIVTIEKLAPRGDLIAKVAGAALIAWGIAKVAGF